MFHPKMSKKVDYIALCTLQCIQVYMQTVGAKKTKKKKADEDVKDVMRDYYKDKKMQKPKTKKKKKSTQAKQKKKHPKDPSVDYMEEEKDLNYEEYAAKTDEIDRQKAEKERRDKIEKMKEEERKQRIERERQNAEKLAKEKAEKERLRIEAENAERIRKENELKEQQRLQKEKEKQERLQKEAENAERMRKEKQRLKEKEEEEQRKLQEIEAEKAKEAEEKKQRELMAQKLEKEQKKQEEEKKTNSAISYDSGGSLKDRMARFETKNDTNTKSQTSPTVKPKSQSPAKSAPKTMAPKKQIVQTKQEKNQNVGNGVGIPVGSEKAINFEMKAAFGKPLTTVTMTKVNGYSGEIPLVLHLLGQKLVSLDKFGTFGIFHPEQMEKESDKAEMQVAHNIFVFFSSLPQPLLSTVPQSVKDKAINKDVMKDVVAMIDEPFASTLCYLWDLLAKVAMNPNAKMGEQALGKVFGPMCTMVTQQDIKGNRVSMNALGASRMMAFFRRGIEWRMELQGYDFDDSSDDSD